MGRVTPLNIRAAKTVTITSGAALSTAAGPFSGRQAVAVLMPAAWTTAGLRFYGSLDGATYYLIYADSGSTEYRVASTQSIASVAVSLDPTIFLGYDYLKIESATTGTATNQGADRILTVIIQ